MGMSDYLEDKLLRHVFRSETYTPPTNIYLALFTAGPADDGTGTEVTGGSYARQIVTYAVPTTPAGRIANDAPLSFLNMPACTIVGSGTLDALTGGNLLTYDALASPRTVVLGENLSVAIGDHRVYFL